MPRLHIRRFLLTFLLLALLKTQSTGAVPSESQDIWRVDSRAIAQLRADEQNFSKLKYYRWKNNRWQVSDAETFFDTQQAEIPLHFFALGFTLTTQQITQTGFDIVRHFDPNKPCRIVFWDWYSDRNSGTYRHDIRKRLPIADNTGDYLALFLQKLKPQSKTCLFGFSLGNRVICEALEALRKNDRCPVGLRIHLVIAGAAIDWDTFAKGHQHGELPKMVEKILVLYNPHDFVLRFYPAIYGCRCRPAALGSKGLPMQNIDPAYRNQFENVNVERYIGGKHQTLAHVQSPAFHSRIGTYFFFE